MVTTVVRGMSIVASFGLAILGGLAVGNCWKPSLEKRFWVDIDL